jgi:DNA-binding transcriptional regulator GbsR (MarR family)
MARQQSSQPLDAAASVFVEKFGMFMLEIGLPPSVARVIGLLLICEPRYCSAEAIQLHLRLSAGSVSSALLMLQQLSLVSKVTFPEDRHFYYELDADCWQKLVDTRRRQMAHGKALAEEGLAISKDNKRIKDMRRMYEVFELFLEDLHL